MATDGSHDVIVLDVMLPHMDGMQVCKSLRRSKVDTPVLLLTALDSVDDRVRGLDSGADDYLPKPFAFQELLARLRALSRRRVTTNDPLEMEIDGLRLDVRRRRAERDGKAIDLSPKEFSLLEFLMRHPGEVMSKQAILDNVWDWAFDGDPNIVEVYIGYLRRKIDDPFGRASIQTVRGVGYRLVGHA
jgi:two-component system OmpR family response regulator